MQPNPGTTTSSLHFLHPEKREESVNLLLPTFSANTTGPDHSNAASRERAHFLQCPGRNATGKRGIVRMIQREKVQLRAYNSGGAIDDQCRISKSTFLTAAVKKDDRHTFDSPGIFIFSCR
jgi:hypothetical protein